MEKREEEKREMYVRCFCGSNKYIFISGMCGRSKQP